MISFYCRHENDPDYCLNCKLDIANSQIAELEQQLAQSRDDMIRQLEALSQPIQAVAGPPDLTGVPDDAFYIVHYPEGAPPVKLVSVGRIRNPKFACLYSDTISWHAGPIMPPPAEPQEMPKCPWCGSEIEIVKTQGIVWVGRCSKRALCGWRTETKQTEAEAIEVAKRSNQ